MRAEIWAPFWEPPRFPIRGPELGPRALLLGSAGPQKSDHLSDSPGCSRAACWKRNEYLRGDSGLTAAPSLARQAALVAKADTHVANSRVTWASARESGTYLVPGFGAVRPTMARLAGSVEIRPADRLDPARSARPAACHPYRAGSREMPMDPAAEPPWPLLRIHPCHASSRRIPLDPRLDPAPHATPAPRSLAGSLRISPWGCLDPFPTATPATISRAGSFLMRASSFAKKPSLPRLRWPDPSRSRRGLV